MLKGKKKKIYEERKCFVGDGKHSGKVVESREEEKVGEKKKNELKKHWENKVKTIWK